MPNDPRIDAYIEKSAGFAQPILLHFRSLAHRADPLASETIKWGMPLFEHDKAMLAMMAVFTAHVGIGIFDGAPMTGGDEGMRQFGKLVHIDDLPDDLVLIAAIHTAVALIMAGKPTHQT